MAPGCTEAASASARMRCVYWAEKVRRLASAITSGLGWGEVACSVAAGKTVREAEEIPLFFTWIPILALLSDYDRGNCLINVGTEVLIHLLGTVFPGTLCAVTALELT